jgi:hypothetical protein
MPMGCPTPRYRPVDLLKDPKCWESAGPKDWRLPQDPNEAGRVMRPISAVFAVLRSSPQYG